MNISHEGNLPSGSAAPGDASWVVRPIEYVDRGEPLDSGIFDDSDRLKSAWDATLATLRSEAQDPAATQEIVERAGQRIGERRAEAMRTADAAERRAVEVTARKRFATSLSSAKRRLVALGEN
jgi:hypothetical protein